MTETSNALARDLLPMLSHVRAQCLRLLYIVDFDRLGDTITGHKCSDHEPGPVDPF